MPENAIQVLLRTYQPKHYCFCGRYCTKFLNFDMKLSYPEFRFTRVLFPLQSFADLWVDFLLKETEEREKRESAGNPGTSTENLHDKSPDTISTTPPLPNQRFGSVPLPPLPNQRSASAFPINSTNQNLSLLPPSYLQRPENFGSDFSTVPLTPSDAKTSGSNLIPRY